MTPPILGSELPPDLDHAVDSAQAQDAQNISFQISASPSFVFSYHYRSSYRWFFRRFGW